MSLPLFSACGMFGGGEGDDPFKFPEAEENANPCETNDDCSGSQECTEGLCVESGLCEDVVCGDGESCNPSTGTCAVSPPPDDDDNNDNNDDNDDDTGPTTCTDDPNICSATQKCENNSCVCDPTKTTCTVSTEACEVEFNASITLDIDDADTPTGHFDAPSACCEYAGADNAADCPIDPAQPGGFLQAPSEASDQWCCAADDDSVPAGVPNGLCLTENRHEGQPELATILWPPYLNKKIKLKFDLSDDQCTVELNIADFPEWRLESTVFDASILIDAGKNYQTAPGGSGQALNPDTVISDCTVGTDGDGNVTVNIAGFPLRFMTSLYRSSVKCQEVDDLDDCPTPFTELFSGDTLQSYQIIPGFNNPTLTLNTLTQTQNPTRPDRQSAFVGVGEPLHFESADSKSYLRLITTFAIPSQSLNATFRNDNLGTGQLQAQLGDAIMRAILYGPVTRASDGQAIQTLEDLTTGCSGGTGPDDDDDGDTLDLGMKLTFNSDQQTLTVDNDDDVEQPFTATACVLGEASGAEDCTFADTTILPFAAGVGDPVAPELASRFTASGTLTLENQGSSNASVILNVPETAGAFTVTNASALQNITLAPAQSTTLDIEFSPIESGSGCGPNEDTGMIDCTATLSLASSHQIEVTLEGQAKVPTAEPKLDEVAPQDSTQVLAALLPDIISLDFGQALVGIQTKSRLLQLSNTGVRDLVINSLAAQDAQQNFRLGSIYQGTDFETRVWKVGQQPWTVPPTGDSNLYFFLNYGPFGSVAGGDDDSTRNDQASLLVASAEGSDTLFLVGTAKEDRRATLAVYIRDETRFTVTGAFDVEGPDGEHLYRATSQFFSFRQDSTPDRAVYVRNDGVSAGVDDLVVNCLEITTATPEKFTITWDEGVPEGLRTCSEEPAPADDDDDDAAPADDDDDDDDDAAPADDDDDDAAPEETTLTLAPQDFLKIGTMTYAASGSGSHTIHSASLTIDALSQQGAVTIPPIIGGNPTTDNNNQVVAFDLKGASGAPTGTFDLKVHRLIAGFERKINAGLQPTLNVSSATRGIIDRFNNPSFPSGTYKDVFTMQDGIVLNPVDGTATLKGIVTPVDPNPNEPILPSALDGLRLFNAPGSIPSQQEYFVQCAALNGSCGFFYLYIGDWTDSTTPMECNGDPDRLPISTGYSGSVAEREAVFNKVLKPEISTEFNCMNSASGIGDSTGGVFDPVTGELRFEDLAVRLYAPDVPGLGGADVDTTMRLSLTSGCVSEDMVPDSAARPTYTVPQNTLDDTSFNQTLMPTNPLLAYVDEAGTTCSQREIFGRPMFQTPTADQAATLDNGSDSDTLNFKGFDLAGVGRDVASDTSVAESNLYIIIRAEIGNF